MTGAWGWQPRQLHVPDFMKSGSLNLSEPSGPHRACYGNPLPLPFWNNNIYLFLCVLLLITPRSFYNAPSQIYLQTNCCLRSKFYTAVERNVNLARVYSHAHVSIAYICEIPTHVQILTRPTKLYLTLHIVGRLRKYAVGPEIKSRSSNGLIIGI
jgi:hypothetical protein